jgi:hypothetical protein
MSVSLHATQTQRGGAGTAVGTGTGTVTGVPILNPEARRWCLVNATPRNLYPRERDQLPIVQEAGWASGRS